jgi:hypothetical protein
VTVQQLVDTRRAAGDARLGFALTTGSAVAFATLVLLPFYATGLSLPAAADLVGALGGLFAVLLGPVVAGLCAYASFAALWSHGDALPASSRHLHLLTLLVTAIFLLALVSPWGTAAVSWWLD